MFEAELALPDFREACSIASGALGNALPVYGGVRLELRGPTLRVEAQDGTRSVTITLDCKHSSGEGSCIPPGRPLAQLVDRAQGESVSIALSSAPDVLTVQTASAVASLRCIANEEWPRPGVATSSPTVMSAADVRQLRRIGFAASTDDNRPTLQALRIDGKFAFATDTLRLVRAALEIEYPSCSPPNSWIQGALRTVKSDSQVLVQVEENRISLAAGNVSWSSGVVVGEYPDVRDLFVVEGGEELVFQRQQVIDAIERLAVFERSGFRLLLDGELPGVLSLSVTHPEYGDVVENLPRGGDWRGSIYFRSDVLADAVRAAGDLELHLRIVASDKAVGLATESLEQILMPLRISGGS